MRRIAENRAHGIKVLVAIGGFEDSFSEKYGRLLSNANARRQFTESVVEFIKRYNFDGLELDLEVKRGDSAASTLSLPFSLIFCFCASSICSSRRVGKSIAKRPKR